ncbi:hypothetical protein ROLI_004820 [Roseobacter fucihabitans]|uniref:GTP-binding protein Era n=1 Tax=Roseobacter fucihabitans TaxID=1537242 RepID=A0ABZ2BPP0_9RHOB|nr:DUF1491 family protein [Roseobacter litoralis]MBC6964656.1 hypothetical protein [Roseobacter litoralis]
MARLTARFWIDAYLARLRIENIPAFIVSHGDDTAGSVLVKVNHLNGHADLYQRSYDLMSDSQSWNVLAQGDEAEMDNAIKRQQGFDPDLWVVEVEDRQGRHLLDQPGLE